MSSVTELIEGTLSGDRFALARTITLVERDTQDVPQILGRLFSHATKAYQVGFTGPPGAGKSTVVDQLTQNLRQLANAPTIGIVAVDPTSPFTGGAILGDRVRMQQHYQDPGVFIRSMATRGSHGGLPGVARRVTTVLAASGKDYVFIETVGVGQTELDIMEVADTVVVILVPEAGDTIQTMKAGLMEIADVFVVNKADREGADKIAREIRMMLHLGMKVEGWEPRVLLTKANVGEGIDELREAINAHRKFLEDSGGLETKRRVRRSTEFFRAIEERMSAGLRRLVEGDASLRESLQRVEKGQIDPYSAAADVLKDREILQRWLARLG